MEGISQKRGKSYILCDTNVFFAYFKGNEEMKKELDEIGFDRLHISVVSVGEIYHLMLVKERTETKRQINKYQVQPVTILISDLFEHMMYSYHKFHPSVPDCLIAATALSINAELFTLNKKHFTYYKGIKFYRPKYKHKRI